MLKLANHDLLVAQHFLKLGFIHQAFKRMRFGERVTPPDLALNVMLKQDARDAELARKIHGCIEKVAHRDVEPPLAEPGTQPVLNVIRSEAADSVRRTIGKPEKIIKATRRAVQFALACVHGLSLIHISEPP